MKKYALIISIALIFLSAACTIYEDPRAMADTHMVLSYDGESCLPYESFIPLGEEIEIKLQNSSEFDITWYLIFPGLKDGIENLTPDNILAIASAPAGETSFSTFRAPYLPARYDSFCVQDNELSNIALTYVLVVEPYDKKP